MLLLLCVCLTTVYTSGFVCCWCFIYPGDSVAKFTWRNSAYLSGSKCITFVICIYSFCFFDRVSSILTSLALTILHCSNYCHVETVHPHHKHTILPEYSVRQCAYGGGDGNRTHVHNNFETTSTNYFTASVCLCLRLFFNNFNHSFLINGVSCLISASYNFLINSLTFIFRPTTYFNEIRNYCNIKLFRCQPSLASLPFYWHQLVLASP